MEMESKYYTPKLEEFHIGFEYELIPSIGFTIIDFSKPEEKTEIKWATEYKKGVFMISDVEPYGGAAASVNAGIKNSKCRVKYLNQEDIESFGFGDKKRGVLNWYRLTKRCEDSWASYGYWNNFLLIHDTILNRVKIVAFEYETDTEENVLFQGSCKNKSELRKLLEQLNIIEDEA